MTGAIVFAVIIGLLMQAIFRKEDEARLEDEKMFKYNEKDEGRTLGQMSLFMFSMIGILVFVNWADSKGGSVVWDFIYNYKYYISAVFILSLIYSLVKWFNNLICRSG